jgi:hypothetical protein
MQLRFPTKQYETGRWRSNDVETMGLTIHESQTTPTANNYCTRSAVMNHCEIDISIETGSGKYPGDKPVSVLREQQMCIESIDGNHSP